MKTESEDIISKINSNVFFKEFTFDENDFYPVDGKKELADNILWLDNLLFLIQIKERNPKEVKTRETENNWFQNTVLKKAKRQIKTSLDFFSRYNEIIVKNRKKKSFDVSKIKTESAKKIIIYVPNSNLLDEVNNNLKFYESKDVGNIHLFSSKNYFIICKFLITPTEVNDYLNFRERFYAVHRSAKNTYSEQYLLAHFLNTEDESVIREEYLESLSLLESDIEDYDMYGVIDSFQDRIRVEEQKESTGYYQIIGEIAKLKRYELLEFKSRFFTIIDDARNNDFSLPYRFTSLRTGCGFVFIPLSEDKAEYWENALLNFTEMYKYKRKLTKCVGIVSFKKGDYYDFNWCFLDFEWEYKEELEKAVKSESEFYGEFGEVKELKRYKFKK